MHFYTYGLLEKYHRISIVSTEYAIAPFSKLTLSLPNLKNKWNEVYTVNQRCFWTSKIVSKFKILQKYRTNHVREHICCQSKRVFRTVKVCSYVLIQLNWKCSDFETFFVLAFRLEFTLLANSLILMMHNIERIHLIIFFSK